MRFLLAHTLVRCTIMGKKPKFGQPLRWYGWWERAPDDDNMDKVAHTPPVHIKEIKKVGKSNKKICTIKGY